MGVYTMGRGWLVAMAAGLLATAAPGWHKPARTRWVAARAAQAAGQAGRAYELLAPLADARAGDPAFDYALGLAAVDSGRPSEAIVALQRVLAVQPNNGPARAELARAYAAIGDIDTARAEFDTVVGDPSIPDPVRQRFSRLVRDFDRQIAGGADEIDRVHRP
jgi:predicted Zn-dependent protease